MNGSLKITFIHRLGIWWSRQLSKSKFKATNVIWYWTKIYPYPFPEAKTSYTRRKWQKSNGGLFSACFNHATLRRLAPQWSHLWHLLNPEDGIHNLGGCAWVVLRIALTHWGREKMGPILADDIFKCNFVDESFFNFDKILLNFVPDGPINNKSPLVQVMAWRWIGDNPLSEPMMTWLTDEYASLGVNELSHCVVLSQNILHYTIDSRYIAARWNAFHCTIDSWHIAAHYNTIFYVTLE